MKKILSLLLSVVMSLVLAVPAFAESHEGQSGDDNRPVPTLYSMKRKEVKKAAQNLDATQLACVGAAVEKRESALHAGFTALQTSITTAYATRHTSLVAAWAMTDADAREAAVKASWKAFKDSVKAARKTGKDVRLASWKTFKTEVKACGLNGKGGESEGVEAL